MIRLPLFHLSTLVLCAVRVAEHDNTPMTAADIAFMLNLPREFIENALAELVDKSAISMEGDRYRYNASRPPTAAEQDSLNELLRQLDEAHSMLADIPASPKH